MLSPTAIDTVKYEKKWCRVKHNCDYVFLANEIMCHMNAIIDGINMSDDSPNAILSMRILHILTCIQIYLINAAQVNCSKHCVSGPVDTIQDLSDKLVDILYLCKTMYVPPILPTCVPMSIQELVNQHRLNIGKTVAATVGVTGTSLSAAGIAIGIMMIPFDVGFMMTLIVGLSIASSLGFLGSPLILWNVKNVIKEMEYLEAHLVKNCPEELDDWKWQPQTGAYDLRTNGQCPPKYVSEEINVKLTYSCRKYIVVRLFASADINLSVPELIGLSCKSLFPYIFETYVYGGSLRDFVDAANLLQSDRDERFLQLAYANCDGVK